MKPKIPIVDDKDTIIGYKYRDEIEKNDIYRVTGLRITNSRGEILLAKRHRSKKHHPGKWGPAVAGTVEEGETYDSNIIKEMEEELGIKDIQPILGPKTKNENDYIHFTQRYILKCDKDISEFTIKEDEVEEIAWFRPEELER